MSHRVVITAGKALSLLTACLVTLGWSASGGQDEPVNFEKARQPRQRMLKGERLSEEERAYLERARTAFQKKQAGARKSITAGGKDHLGLVPLTDMADGPVQGAGRRSLRGGPE